MKIMKKFFYRFCIELTNRKWTSFLLQKFAMSRMSRLFIPSFIKVYKINSDELEKPIQEYMSLNDFFIRQLKKGVRAFDSAPEAVLSPVDGMIETVGVIKPTLEFTVKEKNYSLKEMLGKEEAVKKYEEGTFIVIYLSPSDYHRIHSPVHGKIISKWELGKNSYPVNRLGLLYGKSPLSKNYRRICEIQNEIGRFALVMVGAMFVNSIEYSYSSEEISKGEEIAYFSFGSTVILLFEKGVFSLNDNLIAPTKIKVGEVLGYVSQKRIMQ